jgi:hypothetical protein
MNLNLILKILGIYNLLLIFAGTFINLVGCYLCLRTKLRVYTKFIFFSLMFLSDTFSLYNWCLNHFLKAFDLEVLSDSDYWSCRILQLIEYVLLEFSSWLFVSIILRDILSSICLAITEF